MGVDTIFSERIRTYLARFIKIHKNLTLFIRLFFMIFSKLTFLHQREIRYLVRCLLHLMPVGVPKVPFRSPGEEDASWVDV